MPNGMYMTTKRSEYSLTRDKLLDSAEKHDYAAVAVSWFSEETGFFKAKDLNRNIL